MAQTTVYPPYQQALVDPETRLVTRPWQLFFLSLLPGTGEAIINVLPPGGVPIDKVQYIDAPRLLGRSTAGVGPIEVLEIGEGLVLTDLVLSATATDGSALGYWTPITNGDPLSPELLFDAEGDCVVGFVPTPVTP